MKTDLISSELLNERIVIEAPSYSYDEIGGRVESWSEVATVWAAVDKLPTGKAYINNHRNLRQRYKVIIRSLEGFSEANRLRLDGRYLHIVSFEGRDSKAQFIQIVAESRKI